MPPEHTHGGDHAPRGAKGRGSRIKDGEHVPEIIGLLDDPLAFATIDSIAGLLAATTVNSNAA